mmetsp:Transcript_14702/g.40556  ORF Transcript_14702/g.40556 Transcript_14702/m.40556 type:complete len:311 (+) Transcript_14702:1381-2313(+)
MAIALTTRKYCCTKETNLRLLMPPFSMWRQISLACSAVTSRPSRPSRCAHSASSETRSSPTEAISSKSLSGAMSRRCTSARSAAETWPYLASTMAWHLPLTLSAMAFALTEAAAARASILSSSRFASSRGPLPTLATLVCCSLTQTFASATSCATSLQVFSTSSRTESGVVKASSASRSSDINGFASSSRRFEAVSTAAILAEASAVIDAASLRSRASMWAFFSACSFLMNSAFPACAFFFRVSKLVSTAATAALLFVISVRASTALALLLPAFVSSASFALIWVNVCLTLVLPSSISLSISATNAVYGR